MKKLRLICKSKMTVLIVVGISLLCLPLGITQSAVADGKPAVINVAPLLDLTGPYAPITGPLGPGSKDAFDYINKELNGVNGVKINLILRDYAGKMPLALSMYNEIINITPKPMFTLPGSSPLGAALRERYKDDGIIALSPTSVDTIYPVANTFGLYPLYAEMTAVGLKYVMDNWKEKRPMKAAIITWDTGYGKAILYDRFFEYCKEIGIDIVGTELFGIREQDVTSQLLRLKEKGPDWLITNTTAHGPVVIKKALKVMGWNVPVLNNAGNDWGVISMAPQLFNNDIAVLPTRGFDQKDEPSIQKILKYFKLNNRSKRDRSMFYLIGWITALIQHKAMKDVVDKHGWDGFNIENLKKAMANINNFRPLGGLTEVTYSADRPTLRKAMVYRISDKGVFTPLTGFIKAPDLRPAKYR